MLPVIAATDVINWITLQPFYLTAQQPNYAVGLTQNNNMIISKVGGVTMASNGMVALQTQIQTYGWYGVHNPFVHLGKKFTQDGVSNHGEMCVIAAGDVLADPVMHIQCTGNNCPACASTLASFNVATGNPAAVTAQTGWAHPRYRMALGSSLPHSWANQMNDLAAFNALPSAAARNGFAYAYSQRSLSDPLGATDDML